jgi:hypothetical protein
MFFQILGFLTILATSFLSFKKEHSNFKKDNTSSKNYRLIFVFAVLGVVFTFVRSIQVYIEEKEKSIANKELNDSIFHMNINLSKVQKLNTELLLEQKDHTNNIILTQDTIINYSQKIDSNNLLYFKTYTDILAKYSLHYDSSQKNVVKFITDSAGKKDIPFIETCKDGIEGLYNNYKDTLKFNIKFCNNSSSPAYNIHIKYICFIQKNGKFYPIEKNDDLFPSKPTISNNTIKHKQYTIVSRKGLIQFPIDTIFIIFQGSYTNYYKTIMIPLKEEIDIIIPEKNFWGTFDYKTDKRLWNYINENHLLD